MKTFFVSSTFKDMNYERDAIREITLPKLNAIAKKYGQSVSFCDLRWGIDTSQMSEEEGSKKVLQVCLDEIDRCRPPLVIIIGERYGWIPPKNLVKSIADYKRLLIDDYEKSVTALEIEYGALCDARSGENTLVYIREMDNPPEDYLSEGEEHFRKLNELKSRLFSLAKGKVRTYKAKFNGESLEGVSEFASMLASDLAEIMLPQWEMAANLSPFELERKIQWSYIEEKSNFFKGRDALLDSVIKEIEDGRLFKFIKGDTGSGKSTLFSAIAVKLRQFGWDVLPFICGYTLESNDADDIINNTIYYLEEKLGKTHTESGASLEENAEKRLEEKQKRMSELCFEYAKTGARFIVMADSVENLFSDETRDKLRFIPENLGNGTRFLLTANTSFKTVGVEYDVLNALSDDEVLQVVEGILEKTGYELDSNVKADIKRLPSSKNPLYLSLLIQRLTMMNRNDFFEIRKMGDGMEAISALQRSIIASCSADTDSLCSALIFEAGKRINPTLINKITEYIAFSRFGLREADLEKLLPMEWSALDFAHFLSYMGDSFIMRNDGRFDFSHQSIRRGIVNSCKDPLSVHNAIFDHLQNLDADDEIRQSEILYHAIKAGKSDFVISFTTRNINGNIFEKELKNEAKTVYDIIRTDGEKWLTDIIEYCDGREDFYKFSLFVSVSVASKMMQKQENIASAVRIQRANLNISKKASMSGGSFEASYLFADMILSLCLLIYDAKNNIKTIENSIDKGLERARTIYGDSPSEESRSLLAFMLYIASFYYGNQGIRERTLHAIDLCHEIFELSSKGNTESSLMPSSDISKYHTLAQFYLNLNDRDSLSSALSYASKARELTTEENASAAMKIGVNALLGNIYLAIGGIEGIEKALDAYKSVYLEMKSVYSRSGEISDLNDLLIARNNYVKALLDSGKAGAYSEALPEALENIKVAERVASELGTVASFRPLVLFYMNVGTIYQNLGGASNCKSALESYEKAERVSEIIAKKVSLSGATAELATQKIMIARAYTTVNLGDNAPNALRLINEAIDVLEAVRLEKPNDQSLDSIEHGARTLAAIILSNNALVTANGDGGLDAAFKEAHKAIECALKMKEGNINGWEQSLATAYNNTGLIYRSVYIDNLQSEERFTTRFGSRETMDGIWIKVAESTSDETALISSISVEEINAIEGNSFSNRILPVLLDESLSEEERHEELERISREGDENAERAKEIKDASRKMALEYISKAIDIMQPIGDKLETLECYNSLSIMYQNISELYMFAGDRENILSAIDYQKKSAKLAERIHSLMGSLMTEYAYLKCKASIIFSYFLLEDGDGVVKKAYSILKEFESLYKKWPFAELKYSMLSTYKAFSEACATFDARPDTTEAIEIFENYISHLEADFKKGEEFEENAYSMALACYSKYIYDSEAKPLEYAADLATKGYGIASSVEDGDISSMSTAIRNLYILQQIYVDMEMEESAEYCHVLENLITVCFAANEYTHDYDITEEDGEKSTRDELIIDSIMKITLNPHLDKEKNMDFLANGYRLARMIMDGYDEALKPKAEEFLSFAEKAFTIFDGGENVLAELKSEDYSSYDGDDDDEEYATVGAEEETDELDGNAFASLLGGLDPSALTDENALASLFGGIEPSILSDENALASLFGGIDPSILTDEDNSDAELDEDMLNQLFGGMFPFDGGEDDE